MKTSSPTRWHRVQLGDTLATISELYYDSPEYAGVLYRVNDKYLDNPNNITSGISLIIPYLKS
jgi:nucleoid-associated protein YgaU